MFLSNDDVNVGQSPIPPCFFWNRTVSVCSMSCANVCVKMIVAGAEHTAAVTEDGDLYGWGWGRYGNLGLGERNDRLLPEKVSSVEVNYLIWPGLSFFPV